MRRGKGRLRGRKDQKRGGEVRKIRLKGGCNGLKIWDRNLLSCVPVLYLSS